MMYDEDKPGQPVAGCLVEWDDRKGFGWAEVEKRRVFAHIKEFGRGQRRPVKGDAVLFSLGVDVQGRRCAKAITLVRKEGRLGIGSLLVVGCLLALPLYAWLRLPYPPWALAAGMAFVSLITISQYRSDKKRAEAGQWRIPEARLHFLELLGGWPGAYLAQRMFRHKTRKASFRTVFWFIICLWQVAAVDYLLDHRLVKLTMELLEFVTRK
jgi:uncharacterized membrane protein YsdA (DUF1294 family)/cold shock CspA family protein